MSECASRADVATAKAELERELAKARRDIADLRVEARVELEAVEVRVARAEDRAREALDGGVSFARLWAGLFVVYALGMAAGYLAAGGG